MKRVYLVGIAVVVVAGCSSGRQIVPVSGIVKLNGEPYANAIVTFQPLGSDDDQNPGRGSAGKTGSDGRYTLIYDGEKPGALTGKHRVRICTDLGAGGAPKDDKSETDPNFKPGRKVEPIPTDWHDMSNKEFDVPSKGTDQANFDIETKKPSK